MVFSGKQYATQYRDSAIKSIRAEYKKMVLEEEERSPTPNSAATTKLVEKNIFAGLFQKQVPDTSSNTVLKEIGQEKGIEQEIKLFVSKKGIKSTVSFWKKNKADLIN